MAPGRRRHTTQTGCVTILPPKVPLLRSQTSVDDYPKPRPAVTGPAPRLWPHADLSVRIYQWINFSWSYDWPVASRLAQQFADARDDLVAEQVDVGHELLVCQAWHAVLEVEPGGAQGAEVRGDLAGDGFG